MKLTDVFEQEEINNPASKIIDRIQRGGRLAVYQGLQYMNYDGIKVSEQIKYLDPYAKQISDYLDTSLTKWPKDREVIGQVLDLLRRNAKWPELNCVINQHKDNILWYLLTRAKEALNDTRDDFLKKETTKLIDLFVNSGIAWSELDTIKHSLASKEKQVSITEDSDEPGSQEDFVKHSVLNLLKNNNAGAALNIINAHYKSDPRNLEWLRTNITPILLKHYNKKKLLQWVAKSVDAVTMPRIVSARNLLKQLGVELPDIKTIIDDNKDHIIKRYLQVVKNHQSVEPVIKDIQNLRELGITWPELDIIQKSMDAEQNKSMNENITATGQNYNQILRDMLFAIEDYDEQRATENFLAMARFWMLFQVLEYIWYHVTTREHVKWFYDLQKRPIMVYLLEEFKDSPDSGIPEHIVKLLRKAKMDWPEIDIVERSLAAVKANK